MRPSLAGQWLPRLKQAARELRQSPDTATLQRAASLLEELIPAAAAAVAILEVDTARYEKSELREGILKLRREIIRAEAIQRQVAAAEADWMRVVWAAMGAEQGTSYSPEGQKTPMPALNRLTWEG